MHAKFCQFMIYAWVYSKSYQLSLHIKANVNFTHIRAALDFESVQLQIYLHLEIQ